MAIYYYFHFENIVHFVFSRFIDFDTYLDIHYI
jgi:hypothetical protein